MGRVIPLRPSHRRQASTTDASGLVSMFGKHVTSSVRTDLERVAPERRRHAIWDVTSLPPGTRVSLHVGGIDWPDPDWLRLLAHAVVENGIRLELETDADHRIRCRWHHGVLRAIEHHQPADGAQA